MKSLQSATTSDEAAKWTGQVRVSISTTSCYTSCLFSAYQQLLVSLSATFPDIKQQNDKMCLVSCQHLSNSLWREATRCQCISLRYYGGEEGRSGGGRGGGGGGGGGPRERWTHSPICADFRFSRGGKKYNDSFSSRLYRDGPYMPPPPTDVADPASLQELQVIWEVTFTRLTSQNKVPSIFKSPWRSE